MSYYLHRNTADLVDSGSSNRADRTYQEVTDEAPPLLRLREQFPESFERPIEVDAPVESPPSRSVDDVVGEIFQEDVRTYLTSLPDDSVHCAVTSPPYWSQRDYGTADQIGQEPSAVDYLQTLLGVLNELGRVVRDDGTIWVIVDDTRLDGSLSGIPEQLHDELSRQFSILHHSPWVKSNGGKPDPAPNRFADSHERVLALTPGDSEHFFARKRAENERDVFDVPVGHTDTDHDAVFPKELPQEILKAAAPERVCASCGAPHAPVYEVTDIRNLASDRPQAQRALTLADEHDLSDAHLEALRAVGLGDTGQSARVQSGTGNNRGEIEQLAAEARDALGSYGREFTSPRKEQTGYEKTCGCSADEFESGLVVDPFAGSGTTLRTAKQLRYRWAGCELNPDYVAHAQQRLGVTVDEPGRLTTDDQTTLGDW